MAMATIKWTDPVDGSETIVLGTHELHCGGVGDGYCYAHQSFKCMERLTAEERRELQET